MSDVYLAIDLGTGGPKVGVVDQSGEVVEYGVDAVGTHYDERGAATQDPREWWALIQARAGRLLAVDDRARRLRGVAVTGQYASTVPVDASGEPTGPCLTWMDTRGGPYSRSAVGGPVQGYNPRAVLAFVRKTGGAPSLAGADPVGHLLYLAHDEPELVERTRWFLEPVDFLTMRLTGVASATHASRLAMWMTDNRRLDRLAYDDDLLRLAGIDGSRLPPLVPFGAVVGSLLPDVAREWGVPHDVPVTTGIPDLHAAALGAGATEPYATHLALSTTSWIACPVPQKKTDVVHGITAIPGLSNDRYLVINNQEVGAKALEWFRGTLGDDPPSYDDLTALAATSPPGARGVRFAPWLAGERSPVDDKSARAGFSDLSITTSRADMVRAVMEGVAANSAWLFSYVERFAGRRLEPIRLLGGGAQSDLWCQIYADTLEREVVQVPDPLVAQLRGVARLAEAAAAGRPIGDVGPVREGQHFTPDAERVEVLRDVRRGLPQRYRLERSRRKRR